MTAYETLEGAWHCAYWYPSNTHDGEDASEYEVSAYRKGDSLVLESQPNEIGAYMFVRLTIDGRVATGTWFEGTSPHGEFKGMIYSGAMQLIVSHDKQRMTGKWVGIGRNRKRHSADVYTGKWQLTRERGEAA